MQKRERRALEMTMGGSEVVGLMFHKWRFGDVLSDPKPPKSSSAFWALQQLLVGPG